MYCWNCWFVQVAGIACLLWATQLFAQNPRKTKEGDEQAQIPSSGRPSITFALDNADDVHEIKVRREVAISTAVRHLLRERPDGLDGDDDTVKLAIRVLADMRAQDSQGLSWLIYHCDLRQSVTEDEGPLAGMKAAKALIEIGGKQVATEILLALRRDLSRKKLMTLTYVLASIDSPEITLSRVRLALDKERSSAKPDPRYLTNLEQLRHLLQSPIDLRERDHWPSRLP